MDKQRLADRYQNQPWYIKLYRQLRYTPIAFIYAVRTYITAGKKARQFLEMSRFNCAVIVFRYRSVELQYWYTTAEVFAMLGGHK